MASEEENRKVLRMLVKKYPQVKLFKNKKNDIRLEAEAITFEDLNLMMEPAIFLQLVKDFIRLAQLSIPKQMQLDV